MNVVDIIRKKRDGEALSREETEFWVSGMVGGSVPDYQVSALLMAFFLRGMTDEETAVLTDVMAHSGTTFTADDLGGFTVDKHSTGGVGDTTTLVLIPLLASAGLTVGKLSGRALGHTGGTIDKLESIPGFRTDLSRAEFLDLVRRTGLALADHTADMVPADRILYELRDVTATVDSLPLIVASIMSKKIAGGARGIVIDVKTGAGAFLPKLEDSRRLARSLVSIGTQLGRKMSALITDMSQPLGRMVGNALEVREAVDTLSGRGPEDLATLCCALGAELVVFAGKATTPQAAAQEMDRLLRNGRALETFRDLIVHQGGNPQILEDLSLLPRARREIAVAAGASGTVARLDALAVGRAANLLGAGRYTKEDTIDPAVGVELRKKVGESVEQGAPLAVLHVNREDHVAEAERMVAGAYTIDPSGAPHEPPPLIVERVTASQVPPRDAPENG
ncbi:MAG: thymidine phosphorylase [Candidatus Bipolaricaulis sp.]|nr:thymidine phosphorylase [Candidatus Bipolaricaulis sp.]MDD5219119.1 thymidine phosphorylase [Candidatus Bipolaricaulis sp.]